MDLIEDRSFWQYDISYWIQKLNSSELGLSSLKAKAILQNQSSTLKKRSGLQHNLLLFIGQFKSPLMLLLIGAIILSALLGDTSDVIIILFIVIASGSISYYQERNASLIVEKLQALISLKTTVLRDNIEVEVLSSQIVPGDVLVLNAGDMIPADCLIIDSNNLQADESSLTGETFPVNKESGVIDINTELSKRSNCLWEGSHIVSGKANALVILTGSTTIFGSISKSAANVIESHFEKSIKDFGFYLMKITLLLSTFILIINLFNHKSFIDSILFSLAIAVGMAPELLPAITTIAMSYGAKRMLEKKVIVKKLNSIQSLGEINLLCTDKTGTITEGIINLSGIINYLGKEDDFVKSLAVWNAKFQTGYTNPIDQLLKNIEINSTQIPILKGELPYDFARKRLSVLLKYDTNNRIISKGSYGQIINLCSKVRLSENHIEELGLYKDNIEKKYAEFGQMGLRVIAICYRDLNKETLTIDDEKEMIFAGFIILKDPVKSGIKETIAELKKLHVDLKIITGDNRIVALSIALELGIEDPIILTGNDLKDLESGDLEAKLIKTHIFSEVEPQQKEKIIFALRNHYSVAYIGDGINDVSAINAADVGVSVENAVDIAKEAADFVLMEKDLMVLVDGIKEGRKTFENTLKYIFISTGSTFGNMCSVAVASLILPFLPMLPKQILLTNFITDFPYMTIASDNVDSNQLEKPGKWNLKLIQRYMFIFGIHSSVFDIITFLTLLYFIKAQESAFQTSWFLESVLSELFILFIIRTQKSFYKSKPSKYLLIFSCFGLIITLLLPYIPLGIKMGLSPLPILNLSVMLIIVLVYIISADVLKIWFFKNALKNKSLSS